MYVINKPINLNYTQIIRKFSQLMVFNSFSNWFICFEVRDGARSRGVVSPSASVSVAVDREWVMKVLLLGKPFFRLKHLLAKYLNRKPRYKKTCARRSSHSVVTHPQSRLTSVFYQIRFLEYYDLILLNLLEISNVQTQIEPTTYKVKINIADWKTISVDCNNK